jgi:excinuclease ABC subunit A
VKLEIDPNLVIPNKNLTLAEGAVQPWARSSPVTPWYYSMLHSVANKYGFSVHTPVKNLTEEQLNIILYGTRGRPVTVTHETQLGKHYEWDTSFEGVIPNLERRYRDTESDYVRSEIERYMTSKPCPACKGLRLKPEALAVTVGDLSISKVTAMSIELALDWTGTLDGSVEGGCKPVLSGREMLIARQILKEIKARLGFLLDVGLDYLTLDRIAGSLSGGEAERIRLATQIGSGLMGVLYICDEPTVGLHPVDGSRLIETLKRLRDLGNTLLIVEHDEAMMRAADHIIDMGPGAGEKGGWVVACGTIEDIMACPQSLTGQYLSGVKEIPVPKKRRSGSDKFITIKGARQNNLRNIDVQIPLGVFVCVTGVSGSGKSSLIDEILHRKLAQILYKAKDRPGECDGVYGVEHIDKVVNIDQSPIGRTPRSNPATYTGAFTPIRQLFSTVPEARMRG